MALGLSACDDPEMEKRPGELQLNFALMAGEEALNFDNTTYQNAAGNNFSVRSFWMYFSNIIVKGAEGTNDYIIPESYHLIEGAESVDDLQIALSEIPAGTYQGITLSIGVDAATNTDISAVQGELDPARAWNWDSGYKFVSLEGSFFPAGADAQGLIMHIGLNQNYRTLNFTFDQALEVNANQQPVNFQVDVLRMFSGVHTIDFNVMNTIKAQPEASGQVADNYASGMLQLVE